MPLNIRDLASECGVAQKDLLALSPANDPFALHQPARLEKAAWFATLWRDLGFGFGIHIRRVHYRLVSTAAPLLMPDGRPYINTLGCWQFLINAARDARYLRLVPAGLFVDRRNPDPITFFSDAQTGRLTVNGGDLPLVWLPDDFPDLPFLGMEGAQYGPPALVEIWCEKTTANDVLLPLAQRYNANLITGAGEMSLTSTRLLLDRARRAGLPTRILYISDFDPGGRSMPVAVARKVEFALDGEGDLDIKLYPIALLPRQVTKYRLPRTPIKETEKRGARFEADFGAGAVELDALEALHPGELARIVGREIERYIDPDAKREFDEAAGEHLSYLQDASEVVHEEFAAEVDPLRAEYADIHARLDAWRAKADPVFDRVAEVLSSERHFYEFVPPEPKEPDDPPDPLFDSSRSYIEQIDHYKAWQSGETDDDDEAAE